MKKLLFFGVVALTGCLWADRTANRGWVARNFAPSNVVGRVEALETRPTTESDPVFSAWKTGIGVAAGSGSAASGVGSVALGMGAAASAEGAVQLGAGTNDGTGTLQFRGYRLVEADGSVPSARLTGALSGSIPRDGTGGVQIVTHSIWKTTASGCHIAFGYGDYYNHGRKVDASNWISTTFSWNFLHDLLLIDGEGVKVGGDLIFPKNRDMTDKTGDYESLDQRIRRIAQPDAANVLSAIQAMNDTQKAALKAALGL